MEKYEVCLDSFQHQILAKENSQEPQESQS